MNRDEAKELLKGKLPEYVKSITEPDRRAGRYMYKCPLCGSGYNGGRNSNGAFSITSKGDQWRCFSCDKGGDIFNLISLYEGLPEYNDQLKRAAELFGVTIDRERPAAKKTKRGEEVKQEKKPEPQAKADYSQYIAECKAAVGKTDYLTRRGFTAETIAAFNLGYDVKQEKIVIPYNRAGNYYITRSTSGKAFRKPKSDEAGQEPIYNKAALYSGKPCFVCEAPLDAISIMQEGGNAIALGGTGIYKLEEALKQKEPAAMLILSFDNDGAGQTATEQAIKVLTSLKAPYTVAAWTLEAYQRHKDANEMLVDNAKQFSEDVKENAANAYRLQHAEEEENKAAYKELSGAGRLEALKRSIRERAFKAYTSTGFKHLDAELDGGLYSGLYILGAVSSLGKTTLALQIADSIAKSEQDVIIFALEMAAGELMGKSISRLTYELAKDKDKDGYSKTAKTYRGYTTYKLYSGYSADELKLIEDAEAAYMSFAERITYIEGLGNIGVEQIKEAVKRHIDTTGNKPIVIIDYLQIIAPADIRASDKQNTDKAILELKRLSRDYELSVIGISSFNRDNYANAVSMAAFKESGAIEYGSDVLIALQPAGMKEASTDKDKAANKKTLDDCKAKNIRDVEAVILKNRNGKTGGKVQLTYRAAFNSFIENDNGLEEWRASRAGRHID